MVLDLLHPEARRTFLRSPELQALVEYKPQIMDHKTLTLGKYRPGMPIEPKLRKEASEEHRKRVTGYLGLADNGNREIEDRVLNRAAELLYIVRSNIAHGEKTRYGPDLEKRERDEQVCRVVVPVQLKLLALPAK